MIKHFFDKIEGWFSFREQYDRMIDELPKGSTIVEVGTWHGKSLAYLVVENLNKDKQFKIYSVDSYDNDYDSYYKRGIKENKNFLSEAYQSFKNNLKDYTDNFTQYICKSWDGAKNFEDETIDYAMIDAGHSYDDVKRDIEAYWPKIKKNGYIGGDDYNSKNDVGKAVDEFVKNNNLKLETVIAKNPVTGQLSSKQHIWLIKK